MITPLGITTIAKLKLLGFKETVEQELATTSEQGVPKST